MNGNELVLYLLLGLAGFAILITPIIFFWGYRQNAKRDDVEFVALSDANVEKKKNGNLKFSPRRLFNYMIAVPIVLFLIGIVVVGVNEVIPAFREGNFSPVIAGLVAFSSLLLISVGFASLLPLFGKRTCVMYPSTKTVRVGWKRYKYEHIQKIVIEGSKDFDKKRKGDRAVYIRLKMSQGESVLLGGFKGFVSQTMKKRINEVLRLIKEALGDDAGNVTIDNQMW
jgi:hypothetical protein